MSKSLKPTKDQEDALQQVLEALRSIKYGSIQLVVQDGRIVQIEKVEKVRMPQINANL